MVLALYIGFVFYFLMLLILILGWRQGGTNNSVIKAEGNAPFISVIIPARNEAKNIEDLLADLAKQTYPQFQVVVVDDHSEDNTSSSVVGAIVGDPRFRLIKNEGAGKKAALATGIKIASGPILVTTDADCRVSSEWLSALTSSFDNEKVKMVFGPVRMESTNLFSSLQSLEFASLIGSGMSMASWNYPIMCNGANLAFRKTAFDEVGGHDDNLHIPSGDDEFLMRKIQARYPGGVRPAFHRQSVVSTSPNITLNEFLQQRIRWAGKWPHNTSLLSKALAVFIFCFQLSIVLLPLLVATGRVDIKLGAILVLSKASIEFLFLKMVSNFLSLRWNWVAFAILQFVYPLYVVFVGLLSNFNSFDWKGRKLKSLTVSDKLNKEILG